MMQTLIKFFKNWHGALPLACLFLTIVWDQMELVKKSCMERGPRTRSEACTSKHLHFETILESSQTFCIASHDQNNHTYQMVSQLTCFSFCFILPSKKAGN